ncbi:MAG: UDP-glucose/GDP-mannose dehydrogenase family protein [Prevotellaceae bacterium]|jgi:UDPglucose 6-dehydrogenase|nr:UDP-glucose/GDP-mannose dehydrogenase family protein [Prevotellaceae bacterium]
MKIAIVGSGYVGLVTGTCLAEVGFDVVCVDVDATKIARLQQGESPIYEPGLDSLLVRNIEKRRLTFSTSIAEALSGVEIIFSTVGTPPNEDGSADLRHVLDVAHAVGQSMTDYVLMVTKSTVPVGTAALVQQAIQEELDKRHVQIDFDIASNPEFLKEGNAITDFMKPERIVIGVESERARQLLEKLYKPFVLNGHPVIFTDIVSAEMIKYAANAMLATRISFMNDIANLCELVGADINMVRKGIGSDSRIGSKFLYAGIGYGGSCFPKDVKAIIKTGDQYGYSLDVLKAVEAVNERQKSVLFNKLHRYFDGQLSGKTIALLGLAFKPNTDDMREAPSLVLIELLQKAGCHIRAYDPVAMDEACRRLGDSITCCADMYEALQGADAMMLLTEWNEFRAINPLKIKSLLRHPIVLDGRNIYDAADMRKNGIRYFSIGRKELI